MECPGPSTQAVHAGQRVDDDHGALTTPVVQAATYRYPERADGSAAPYIYSRYDNPTVAALEARVAALEGAAGGALAFASGMGAASALLATWLHPGDTIAVVDGAYGGTMALLQNELAPRGINVAVVAPQPGPTPLQGGTRVVWLESITNPLLRVADVEAWAAVAATAGARLVVDATFASPVVQRPLTLGADAVLHSATKYLAGHSDVTAGAVAFRDGADRDAVWRRRRDLGATLDPHAAFLVERGIKTLGIRMARHGATATELARRLAADDRVVAVHYPGLPDHPDHALAARVLQGGSGMVTLDVGSRAAAQAFRRNSGYFAPAASLGGVESLVSLPLETSHAYATPEARTKQGISDGLLRLSVGIEDADDLWASLDVALGAAAAAGPSADDARR